MAGGRWLLAGGRWPVAGPVAGAGGRWPGAGGRWPGRWPVAGPGPRLEAAYWSGSPSPVAGPVAVVRWPVFNHPLSAQVYFYAAGDQKPNPQHAFQSVASLPVSDKPNGETATLGAQIKFREGSCPSKLTHPFVGNAGEKLEKDVATST